MFNQYQDKERVVEYYIIELNDDVVDAFLNNDKIRAAATRTNSKIQLTKRIYNKQIFMQKWIRFGIVQVSSVNENSLSVCNRMIEQVLPIYRKRIRQYHKPDITLFTKTVIPDNMELYYSYQRLGVTGSTCGTVEVNSPYEFKPERRTKERSPWKHCRRDATGSYRPRAVGTEKLLGFYGRLDEIAKKVERGEINLVHYTPEIDPYFGSNLKIQEYRSKGELTGAISPTWNARISQQQDFEEDEYARKISPMHMLSQEKFGISKHYKNLLFGQMGEEISDEYESGYDESTVEEEKTMDEDDEEVIEEVNLQKLADESTEETMISSSERHAQERVQDLEMERNNSSLESNNAKNDFYHDLEATSAVETKDISRKSRTKTIGTSETISELGDQPYNDKENTNTVEIKVSKIDPSSSTFSTTEPTPYNLMSKPGVPTVCGESVKRRESKTENWREVSKRLSKKYKT